MPHDSAVRKVLMLADQMRKGGSDVGTEHLLLTDGEEATGTPPLHPGLGPSLLVGPHKGPHTPAHEGPHVPCLLFAACIESLGSRRKAITAVMAGLGAEAAWRRAVAAAETAIEAVPATSILPPGTIEQIQAGRAVVVSNWLPPEEAAALCADQIACLEAGHFKEFISNIHSGTILSMPSFLSSGKDFGFADPAVGNFAVRQQFKARMAAVKAALAKQLQDRPSLANDISYETKTHEIQYLHYRPGAQVFRHVDEKHVELKRPNGSRLPKKPGATRRSVTWLVYLNNDWDPRNDGGQLRLHERAQPSTHVGALDQNLQVGWLRATGKDGEQPVFLDPFRGAGPEGETCMLYTCDAGGSKRDLSREPFANAVLQKTGGDTVASLMMDDPVDARRFHLIDAPKTIASKILPSPGPEGEDGGERVREIVPQAGTLVLFDSVSLPHEVLATKRLRYGLQGWFHEQLYY